MDILGNIKIFQITVLTIKNFAVDNNLHPWLIEMNISPSLHSSTSLDANVKAPLAADTLTMAGIPFPIRLYKKLKIFKESPLIFSSDDEQFQTSLYFRTR